MTFYWLDTLFRKRFNFYKNFVEKRLLSKYTAPIVMITIVVLFSVIFMQDLAVKNANTIKNDGKDNYQVKFSENGSADTIKSLELLGSTSRFAYFYDPEKKQSVVISPENLSFMRKSVAE